MAIIGSGVPSADSHVAADLQRPAGVNVLLRRLVRPSGQICLALLPSLIACFSPSVFRCFGAGTSEASTSCPAIGMYPFVLSCQSKAFITRPALR